MKKTTILILVLISIIIFLLAKDCGRDNNIPEKVEILPIEIKPVEPNKPIIIKEELPYVKDGFLYTETRTVAVKDIMRIDLDTTTVNYVIITWQKGKYSGGIFSMSMSDFRKIAKDLGVKDV